MKTKAGFSLSPFSQRALICFLSFCSLSGIVRVIGSFAAASIYHKDFIQGYVLAQALRYGMNPYLPIPELVSLWLPTHNVTTLLHPTPHPLPVGWLCLPFALL